MHTLKFSISLALFALGITFGLGFFKNLFHSPEGNGFAESQKFSTDKKIHLIKQLAKKRVQNDPVLKEKYRGKNVPKIDDLPEMMLMGLPEGTIVSIVEVYWMMRNQAKGSDKEIFQAIESHRAPLSSEKTTMPSPLTLSNYVKYRLKIDHSDGVPISDKIIETAIEEANKAYR